MNSELRGKSIFTKSHGSRFFLLSFVFWLAAAAYCVPRDIVVHRDGTKVEGSIIEENEEKIVIRTQKYGDLHFRKIDLVKVERGVDPEAAQSTQTVATPQTYDYRVYIPQGPLNPEKPVQPIFIAELIRRGLTPPPPTASPSRPQAENTPGHETPEPTINVREQKHAFEERTTPTSPAVLAKASPAPTELAAPASREPSLSPPPEPRREDFALSRPSTTPAMEQAATPTATPVPTTTEATPTPPQATTAQPTVPPSSAQGAGTIVTAKGSVLIQRYGALQPAIAGAEIAPGDAVVTSEGALALVALRNGQRLVVGPASELVVNKVFPGTGTDLLLNKGFAWCAASPNAPEKLLTLSALGCQIAPDPSDLSKGIAIKVAVLGSDRVFVASLRGKALLSDTAENAFFIIDANTPVFHPVKSRQLEPKPELASSLEDEWKQAEASFGQTESPAGSRE